MQPGNNTRLVARTHQPPSTPFRATCVISYDSGVAACRMYAAVAPHFHNGTRLPIPIQNSKAVGVSRNPAALPCPPYAPSWADDSVRVSNR